MSADHRDIPALMSEMDAGIFFYKPSYSRTACAPTKLGEFLACSKPCLTNAGVGDMTEILETERVGIVLRDLDTEAMHLGLLALFNLLEDSDTRNRCVSVAKKYFSLEQGVSSYREIYQKLEEQQ